MRIECSLLKKVFFFKRTAVLRKCFGIEGKEPIVFCWIPLLINQSTICICKNITKEMVQKGIVATKNAIYFPQDSTICMGKDTVIYLSEIKEIVFDSHYLVISKNGFKQYKIPKNYFQIENKYFDSENELMAFITGVLNMLLFGNL